MNVADALSSRHSTRVFKPDPVSKDTLLKILAAANRTPSWGNTQPWEVFAVTGDPLERLRSAFVARYDEGLPSQTDLPRPEAFPPELQQRRSANSARRFTAIGIDRGDREARRLDTRNGYAFFGAPAVVYLCMDRSLNHYALFDIGMFAQSIMLAAQGFGVDSVPAICLVDHADLVRAELVLPENLLLVLGIGLGYGAPDEPLNVYRSLRRPIEEIVSFRGW